MAARYSLESSIAFPITLAAFAVLYILARDLLGKAEAAYRSVLYLALYPYAFLLQALYSEATFVVFAIAAFVAAGRKRFLGAGSSRAPRCLHAPWVLPSSPDSSFLP